MTRSLVPTSSPRGPRGRDLPSGLDRLGPCLRAIRLAGLLAPCALLGGCAEELGACDESAARRVVYDGTGSPAFEGQALMISSCGGGAFCHSPDIDAVDRFGVPLGLDYDLRIASEEDDGSADRLLANQQLTFEDRHRIWAEVQSGRMPVPGAVGEDVLGALPVYNRIDPITGEVTAMPSLETEEGRDVLRNWLSCRVPVVERATPTDDTELFGAVVSRREVTPLEPEWADIYARMIEPRCASAPCHGAAEAGELGLQDPESALAAMVDMPAAGADCQGGDDLIVPGDPDASLFVHKLTGRDASGEPVCGDPMPVSGARIDQASIDNIRQWIAEGASL